MPTRNAKTIGRVSGNRKALSKKYRMRRNPDEDGIKSNLVDIFPRATKTDETANTPDERCAAGRSGAPEAAKHAQRLLLLGRKKGERSRVEYNYPCSIDIIL